MHKSPWETTNLICACNFSQKNNNDIGWDYVEDDDDQNMVIVGVENSSWTN
jgi:hypothetical protein